MALNVEATIQDAIRAAGIPITGMRFPSIADKATWQVFPPSLQAAAQPIIDAFNPNDPAHDAAEQAAQATKAMDSERLASAIVWCVIDTYSAPATKAKYLAARTKILDAFKNRPWL